MREKLFYNLKDLVFKVIKIPFQMDTFLFEKLERMQCMTMQLLEKRCEGYLKSSSDFSKITTCKSIRIRCKSIARVCNVLVFKKFEE